MNKIIFAVVSIVILLAVVTSFTPGNRVLANNGNDRKHPTPTPTSAPTPTPTNVPTPTPTPVASGSAVLK